MSNKRSTPGIEREVERADLDACMRQTNARVGTFKSCAIVPAREGHIGVLCLACVHASDGGTDYFYVGAPARVLAALYAFVSVWGFLPNDKWLPRRACDVMRFPARGCGVHLG